MITKVDLDDVKRLLRWLRDQPMDLERMEAELLAMFRDWQERWRKDPTRGDSPTLRS